MPSARLPECPGRVVIHRDDAVTCTANTCPSNLPRGTWFALHSSFRRCGLVHGDGCPECSFAAPAGVGYRADGG